MNCPLALNLLSYSVWMLPHELWLHDLLLRYQADGMSSDDTDTDGKGTIYQVNWLVRPNDWQRVEVVSRYLFRVGGKMCNTCTISKEPQVKSSASWWTARHALWRWLARRGRWWPLSSYVGSIWGWLPLGRVQAQATKCGWHSVGGGASVAGGWWKDDGSALWVE